MGGARGREERERRTHEKVETLQVAVDDLGLPVVQTGEAAHRVGGSLEDLVPADVLVHVVEHVVEGALVAELQHHAHARLHAGAVEEHHVRAPQGTAPASAESEREREIVSERERARVSERESERERE